MPTAYRSSYTFTSAARFIPIFDKLLELYNSPGAGRTSFEIPAGSYEGMSAITFQNRLMDGLKWFNENFDKIEPELIPHAYAREDYLMLKHIVYCRVSPARDKCTLTLKLFKARAAYKAILNADVNQSTPEVVIKGASLKDDIEAFLANPDKTVEMFKNQHPTEVELVWLKSIFGSNPSLEHSWNGRNLTVVKIKD